MIKINDCANRPGYYSEYAGQEEAIREIKEKFPKYFLEDVPLKNPDRAWWNIYNAKQLEQFKALISGVEVEEEVIIGGLLVEENSNTAGDSSVEAVILHVATETGCSSKRCEVLGDNGEYVLIKTSPIQGEEYTPSKVYKVSLADLTYTEVWNCSVKKLVAKLKAELIKKELGNG